MGHTSHCLSALAAGTLAVCLLSATPAVGQDSNQRSDGRNDQYTDDRDQQTDQGREASDESSRDRRADNQTDERQSNQQWSDDQFDDQRGRDQRDERSMDRPGQDRRTAQGYDEGYGQDDRDDAAALGVLLDPRGDSPRVFRVLPDTPAQRAGIRTGDEILALDGQRVESSQQLAQRVRQMNPGDRIEVRLRRDGEQRTIDVRLGEREEAFDRRQPGGEDFGYQDRYGGQPGELDRWDRSQLGQIQRELQDVGRQIRQLAYRLEQLESRLGRELSRSGQGRSYGVEQTGFYDDRSGTYQDRQFDNSRAPRDLDRNDPTQGYWDGSPRQFRGERPDPGDRPDRGERGFRAPGYYPEQELNRGRTSPDYE